MRLAPCARPRLRFCLLISLITMRTWAVLDKVSPCTAECQGPPSSPKVKRLRRLQLAARCRYGRATPTDLASEKAIQGRAGRRQDVSSKAGAWAQFNGRGLAPRAGGRTDCSVGCCLEAIPKRTPRLVGILPSTFPRRETWLEDRLGCKAPAATSPSYII